MTLQCHSRGDKRFSAYYADVTIKGTTKSIETWYQQAKRTANNLIPGKGKPCAYFICPYTGKQYPANELTNFYSGLWIAYFHKTPTLYDVINQYDSFIDIFAGKSINNQAAVITQLRFHKDSFIAQIKESAWYKGLQK